MFVFVIVYFTKESKKVSRFDMHYKIKMKTMYFSQFYLFKHRRNIFTNVDFTVVRMSLI